MKELRIFLSAVMFYTRIPVPDWTGHSEEQFAASIRYLPLIGWIVGGIGALVMVGSSLLFPPAVCAILSVGATVWVTGAFHEDGFADVCDGFGGGWTAERILDIMKDSRLGAYGAIGIILLVGLKVATLTALLGHNLSYGIAAGLLAHVLSRLAAVTVVRTHAYARKDASSKVKPVSKGISTVGLTVAAAWVIPVLLLIGNWAILPLLPLIYLVREYLATYFQRWIGGYTGDCLGAVQQVTEVVTLLYCLALWRYI
jgi:adenosylcobinamide-GDP ribazoletransferase